jgi:site-specific DNA recombinase
MTAPTTPRRPKKPARRSNGNGRAGESLAGLATVRVGVYLRISTDEEHQPFSLEAQEHRLRAFVASQPGWELTRRPYVDQMSGAYLDRPGLADALRDAELGLYDVLVVYRVDRFARKLRVLVDLLERLDAAGVAFRSATEPIDTSTPTGRMLVQMLGVFAEFERETIIDRVVAGMERKAARGEWTAGSPPFGYSTDGTGHLVVDEVTSPLVAVIFDLYARQKKGAHTIAAWLNERGHRTRAGRPWSHTAVLTVLRNRAYLGEVFFRGTWHPAPHPPLVDAEVFERAQRVLTECHEEGPPRWQPPGCHPRKPTRGGPLLHVARRIGSVEASFGRSRSRSEWRDRRGRGRATGCWRPPCPGGTAG